MKKGLTIAERSQVKEKQFNGLELSIPFLYLKYLAK